MSIESLTYAELGNRLGASPEAARSPARRLRLQRRPGNDGKVRITVDIAEIQYKPLPARAPRGQRTETDGLKARVEQLEGELARLEVEKQCLEVRAAGHRADFERERERCDTLVTEALKLVRKPRDSTVRFWQPRPISLVETAHHPRRGPSAGHARKSVWRSARRCARANLRQMFVERHVARNA